MNYSRCCFGFLWLRLWSCILGVFTLSFWHILAASTSITLSTLLLLSVSTSKWFSTTHHFSSNLINCRVNIFLHLFFLLWFPFSCKIYFANPKLHINWLISKRSWFIKNSDRFLTTFNIFIQNVSLIESWIVLTYLWLNWNNISKWFENIDQICFRNGVWNVFDKQIWCKVFVNCLVDCSLCFILN